MRACGARTACLLPLLLPFSKLGHAPVTARHRAAKQRPRSPGSIAIRTTQRSPGGSRGGPDPFSEKSLRFVARAILHVIAADYVRLRKSPPRGGVDMQAIVSAICAHAGHELRPLRWLLHRDKLAHAVSQSVRARRLPHGGLIEVCRNRSAKKTVHHFVGQ